MNYFEKILNIIEGRTIKIYLVLANITLVLLAIIFSNAGMLPFKNFGDVAFFAALALILAIYRPGWSFLLFIGSIALENINLAPTNLGIMLRPYQFMGLITVIAILFRFFSKKLSFLPLNFLPGLLAPNL